MSKYFELSLQKGTVLQADTLVELGAQYCEVSFDNREPLLIESLVSFEGGDEVVLKHDVFENNWQSKVASIIADFEQDVESYKADKAGYYRDLI